MRLKPHHGVLEREDAQCCSEQPDVLLIAYSGSDPRFCRISEGLSLFPESLFPSIPVFISPFSEEECEATKLKG